MGDIWPYVILGIVLFVGFQLVKSRTRKEVPTSEPERAPRRAREEGYKITTDDRAEIGVLSAYGIEGMVKGLVGGDIPVEVIRGSLKLEKLHFSPQEQEFGEKVIQECVQEMDGMPPESRKQLRRLYQIEGTVRGMFANRTSPEELADKMREIQLTEDEYPVVESLIAMCTEEPQMVEKER